MPDVREAVEAAIESTLAAAPWPEPPVLVTRTVMDVQDTEGQRPALILIMGDATREPADLGGQTYDVQVEGMLRMDLDPVPEDERVTWMNAWFRAATQAFDAVDTGGFGEADVIVEITGMTQPAIATMYDMLQGAVLFELHYLWIKD